MRLSRLFRAFLMARIVNEMAPYYLNKFAGAFVTHTNQFSRARRIFYAYCKAIGHASRLLRVFFLVIVFIWHQLKISVLCIAKCTVYCVY